MQIRILLLIWEMRIYDHSVFFNTVHGPPWLHWNFEPLKLLNYVFMRLCIQLFTVLWTRDPASQSNVDPDPHSATLLIQYLFSSLSTVPLTSKKQQISLRLENLLLRGFLFDFPTVIQVEVVRRDYRSSLLQYAACITSLYATARHPFRLVAYIETSVPDPEVFRLPGYKFVIFFTDPYLVPYIHTKN